MTYTRSDFRRRLAKGNITELYLAEELKKAGVIVVKPEYPEGMSASYYTQNQVDLIANDKVLEVKGRNLEFNNIATYPYPTIFVEGVTGFDSKVAVPDYYVNVSNVTGAVIYLDVAATRDTWTIEPVRDRQRNYKYDMYVSRTDQWGDFAELIKKLGGV